MVVLLIWPGIAGAQGDQAADAPTVARRYVEQYIERLRLDARGKLLTKQNERLRHATAGESNLPEKLAAAEPQARQALAAVLIGGAQPVGQDLLRIVPELDRQIRQAAEAWSSVRTAVCEGESLLARVRGEQDESVASLLSLEDPWFWASVLVALGGLLGVAVHAHRHTLRRWSGRRGRTLMRISLAAGFVLLACAVAGLGVADRLADKRHLRDSVDNEVGGPRAKMAEDSAHLEAEAQRLAETARTAAKARAELQEAAQRRLAATAADLSKVVADFRDRAVEIGERLAVLDRLPQLIEDDLAALGRVQKELLTVSDAAARHRQWQRGLRGGIGLLGLGVVVAGAWLLRRGAKRRQLVVTNTCPLCLGAIQPGTASRNGQAKGGSKIVRCTNVLDPSKGVRCDYAIRDAYRAMPKLCFPTLGVPRAGKTHWLAMTYWQLNRGNYPPWVRFERIRPVEAASGEDFDRIVEQILISRLGTTGTQGARIPHPLVFNFSDHDRWGYSSLLVNIFDYSGEVTATLGVDDYRRRRAMEADGYFFFLDPTLPAEPQAKALAEFREDLRLVKGVGKTRGLSLPLALCISKLDLLARQSYALPDGGDAVAKFYEDLARIDPSGETMSLEVIEARSRLLGRLRDTIWPGWQIERTVSDLFGGRVLFFPLTPVGLDGRGESDLSLRTIAPFGLLEPLAWLLQMNGYPVLE